MVDSDTMKITNKFPKTVAFASLSFGVLIFHYIANLDYFFN